jgi:uncharacterized peroxidase-related enzyme
MSNFSFLNTEDGMPQILQRNPERYGGFSSLAEHLLRGDSELSIAERELVFAYVSGLNACSYCFGAHKAIAENFGIDEGLLDRLMASDEPAAAEKKLRPCLSLARKAAQDATHIVPSDIEAIVDAGWSEEAAHDVLAIAALATFSNIIVNGHGVIGSPAHFDHVAKMVGPDGGYSAP